MAESELSVSYFDLLSDVGSFLGYGPNSENWSSAQLAEVDRYIQSGIRQFYYPPAAPGVEAGYEWSFLKPNTTLSTADADAAQDLPDDLGRIVGDLHYAAAERACPVVLTSEARINELLSASSDEGRPTHAAVRFKAGAGENGQRQEIVWFPIPDATYVLTYRYEAYHGKLTQTKSYPLGGMRYSELITESCMSIAEQRANDEKGLHTQKFNELLVTAIAQDRRNGARSYGQMGCSDFSNVVNSRTPSSEVTYKGVTW
jgi:hypothetical protein